LQNGSRRNPPNIWVEVAVPIRVQLVANIPHHIHQKDSAAEDDDEVNMDDYVIFILTKQATKFYQVWRASAVSSVLIFWNRIFHLMEKG
jgi:hypothetical protein